MATTTTTPAADGTVTVTVLVEAGQADPERIQDIADVFAMLLLTCLIVFGARRIYDLFRLPHATE